MYFSVIMTIELLVELLIEFNTIESAIHIFQVSDGV